MPVKLPLFSKKKSEGELALIKFIIDHFGYRPKSLVNFYLALSHRSANPGEDEQLALALAGMRVLDKIEKVKELLMYDELTLSQIAYQLNYSSVAYLSNQFKRETGFTTSFFKQLKSSKRTGIDRV